MEADDETLKQEVWPDEIKHSEHPLKKCEYPDCQNMEGDGR